jgi:hypothetical protein
MSLLTVSYSGDNISARYEELQQAFADMSKQLQEQEKEANEAISSWETKAEELESELENTEQLLAQLTQIVTEDDEDDISIAELPDVIGKLIEAKSSFDGRVQAIEAMVEDKIARVTELEQQLEGDKLRLQVAETEAGEWKIKCDQLESMVGEFEKLRAERDRLREVVASKSQTKLEQERDRLLVVVSQLEEELREANEMVQACITDESADKATEFAAQALREEIQELRSQVSASRQKYEDEKAAREVADLEIERLRDDIAALVSLSDHENTPANLKKLTSKAIENVQKKERAEIEELRKSLFRALDELEVVRSAERESNEKLSKVRLQISVYEQEIIAAKSEINFLTQTMEELRETEESKRASLEYRVGALENENDVVRKYHAAELENVRNELSQITMERDRVLHQLKESEKTNASLVFAASKGESSDTTEGVGNLEIECAKLRVENAHLLTVAADDRGRAERRLREALAAQAAGGEADVILEHELRLSAEAALETLKLELEAVHIEMAAAAHGRSNVAQLRNSDVISKELESCQKSLESMKKENQNLKSRMEKAASLAQAKIDSLTEECRIAQAKLHKLNQEGRFEALIHAEKSKLSGMESPMRRANGNGSKFLVVSDRDPSSAGASEPSALSSAEAFDLIRRQREEILEERKHYREFLEEHDSLLALLATLDMEKKALTDALRDALGDEEAVQVILQNAQETTAVGAF